MPRSPFERIGTRATDRADMYLDTAILVKLLGREPDTDFYVALAGGFSTGMRVDM